MLKIAGAFALLAAAFVGGYGASIRSHGDWLLARTDTGLCAAYDPAARHIVGTWAAEGRCRMSSFVWRQIVLRPLRIVE